MGRTGHLDDALNGRALLQRDLGKLEDWANRSLVEPLEVRSSAVGTGPDSAASGQGGCGVTVRA